MTSNSSVALRQIFDEARPLVEQALDLSEQFKGFRELATANGLDWSQIKALLKAQIQDEREDDGKDRVGRIIEKADFATAYADMLGLGAAKMNEKNCSSELHMRHDGVVVSVEAVIADLPPHDEDGVIIEPDGLSGPSSEEGADAIALDAPSSPTLSPSGELTATETNGGSHGPEVASAPDNKSSDNRQVLGMDREPPQSEFARRGNASVNESETAGRDRQPNSELAAIAPASAAIAPVEQSPSRDVAPGASHSGEMPDLPAIFDRRSKAA